MGDNPVLSAFQLNFVDSSNSYQESINLKAVTSIDSNNRVITCEGASLELGTGNWVLESIRFGLSIGNTVVVSSPDFSFGLSGFSFTLTSSITFSDYLTKQTQDILTNEVVPAVETLDNMPQSVVDALESKSEEEVKEYESSVDENSAAAVDEIEKVMPLMSFQESLTTLSSAFNNETRLDTLILPRAKLPDNIGGGKVLWEEQVVPITDNINKFPTVFVTLSRAVFEAGLMWGTLTYLYNIIKSCFGDNFDEGGHIK